MNEKPYNPAVGALYLKRVLTEQFKQKCDEAFRKEVESKVLGGRKLDDVLELSPETPLGDFLLLLVALRSKLSEEINLTWKPVNFMVMRHRTENFDINDANAEWAEARQAFIDSFAGNEPIDLDLYENPEPQLPDEPNWMKEIPLSK